MSNVPAKVTYLVSKQSNRNLVLDSGVAELPVDGSLDKAREVAEHATRTSGIPHFVHEISVRTLFAFKPGPAVGSEL